VTSWLPARESHEAGARRKTPKDEGFFKIAEGGGNVFADLGLLNPEERLMPSRPLIRASR
jgi:hypothetical protein